MSVDILQSVLAGSGCVLQYPSLLLPLHPDVCPGPFCFLHHFGDFDLFFFFCTEKKNCNMKEKREGEERKVKKKKGLVDGGTDL